MIFDLCVNEIKYNNSHLNAIIWKTSTIFSIHQMTYVICWITSARYKLEKDLKLFNKIKICVHWILSKKLEAKLNSSPATLKSVQALSGKYKIIQTKILNMKYLVKLLFFWISGTIDKKFQFLKTYYTGNMLLLNPSSLKKRRIQCTLLNFSYRYVSLKYSYDK